MQIAKELQRAEIQLAELKGREAGDSNQSADDAPADASAPISKNKASRHDDGGRRRRRHGGGGGRRYHHGGGDEIVMLC